MPRGSIQCPRCGAFVERILPEPTYEKSWQEIATANKAERQRRCPECGWYLNMMVAPWERLPGAPGYSPDHVHIAYKIAGIVALVAAAAVVIWIIVD